MKPLLALLLLSASFAFAQTPDLTLARDKNWLIIQGPHLPKGEIRICQKTRSAPALSPSSAAYMSGFTTGSRSTGGRHFLR